MNRITQIAIVAVLGIGTYVAISAIYTVSEVEQVIITQFGKPVGDPVTSAGLKVKVPFRPGRQCDRQAGSRMGRQSVRHADQGQALHLG